MNFGAIYYSLKRTLLSRSYETTEKLHKPLKITQAAVAVMHHNRKPNFYGKLKASTNSTIANRKQRYYCRKINDEYFNFYFHKSFHIMTMITSKAVEKLYSQAISNHINSSDVSSIECRRLCWLVWEVYELLNLYCTAIPR